MNKTTLILDLDGVLITNPIWKPDEIDSDGYSKFNSDCVENLNTLLAMASFEMWLSSTRRTVKSLDDFNRIFKHRNIKQEINGFLPKYPELNSRKEEIVQFLDQFKISDFLIIDDDKSLNGLELLIKEKLVLTEFMKGFNRDKLEEAKTTLASK
ncbi:HAD domain-containing protein [Aquimarina brevivitae]|uniref:Uncharacterized protein n=1 Tax=Aquimarina brevivitae TaxID=323412 RepID=A0A4Q7PF99_9FLAO|nr:HAD domain-containing protein [Aquimarina brevivitae]RZS99163.1 hypothetical protein EV197_0372 [Aquimarina brevivitae]